ncbi:hypothetical protein [Limobrevibacterium gyesilva]|uniref:Uncharacterized protein n=1 Tax=Limobrevibacterium gyesilva TaxID=2991712 RepID=A0AA42CGF3_9PROT|nr:hypothetical protein [Limobrevibacterium gyesilva]MCW3475981.1 hypothetical protein [Limobrevibacterium gyesilva]
MPPAPAPKVILAAGQAPDATDFLFRLGMLEGHLIIGHDLLRAGQPALALPHFGHPVRELYDDLEPFIAANRIPPFEAQLIQLEAAVAKAPASPETEVLFQAMIATVHKARLTTPAALRDSIPEMIRICSDTVDAAAGEYGQALNRGRIDSMVEYHDSRGYLSYVAQELDRLQARAADPAGQGLLTKFRGVLAKAQWIVVPLLPGSTPRASVAQYRAVAAQAATVAPR